MPRKSQSQAWASDSLLSRLAALETALAGGGMGRQHGQHAQRHRSAACFGLGFATALLLGAIALALLSFATPREARANGLQVQPISSAGSPGAAPFARPDTIAAVAPSLEGRQLWWKLPGGEP